MTAGTNNSVSPRPLRICIFSCAFCMLRRESSAIRAHECFFFFSTCPVSRLFSLLYQWNRHCLVPVKKNIHVQYIKMWMEMLSLMGLLWRTWSNIYMPDWVKRILLHIFLIPSKNLSYITCCPVQFCCNPSYLDSDWIVCEIHMVKLYESIPYISHILWLVLCRLINDKNTKNSW